MFTTALSCIQDAQKIVIIQAENPDGDSLGTSLALEELLGDLGKDIQMHCPIDIPSYMRYFPGWDRVTSEFDTHADMAIIVDTASEVLLSKTLSTPGVRHFLETHPVVVLDHHTTDSDLSFPHEMVTSDVVATGELVYNLAKAAQWNINSTAAEHMLAAIMSDSLGLTTQNSTADSFIVAGELTRLGASNAAIEKRRREFMKKSPEILSYKGELLQRVEYHCDGKLALIHIPFHEIQEYSEQYNPSVLALDEMRLVKGVEIAVAIKTYPDGKATGKIRSNIPISETVAGYFGGGGHTYAAGFRVYDDYDSVIIDLLKATQKALEA